jgi:hypothetical protein
MRTGVQVYESLRRERCARVQCNSRLNGARYDACDGDLADRDRQLSAEPQERAWIWNHGCRTRSPAGCRPDVIPHVHCADNSAAAIANTPR